MSDSYSILLIDDESGYRENFAKVLQKGVKKNFEFTSTGSARQGFEIIQKNNRQGKKTLAFIDIILPDINGDELIKQVDLNNTNAQGVLISAHKSYGELEQIRNNNKWLIKSLVKPIDNSIVKKIVNSYIPDDSSARLASSVNFDYQRLDKSLASYLQQEANEIKLIMKKTVENTLEIGRRLSLVKKTLPHGDFYPWIEQELGLHSTTVLHFMRVWDTFGDCKKTITQLGLNVSILYVLSAPSTPESLRSEVIEMAKNGEPVSIAQVKQLKKEYEQRQADVEKNKTIDVESIETNTQDSQERSNSPSIAETTKKQQIVGIIRQQVSGTPPCKGVKSADRPAAVKLYSLGEHLLYNGLPQSSDFSAHLPSKISLGLGFPPHSDWTKTSLFPVDSQTTIVHDSQIRDDLDILVLGKSIEKSLEAYTNGGETVLFSFLPYPELLILADLLQCRCFIAEPDLELCQKIISTWNSKSEIAVYLKSQGLCSEYQIK